jgi:oxygen-dependent protoporphyrinogen oxidase
MSFLVGLAAGYVLGARAGRHRYAQIKKVSGKVWQSKPVQNQVAAAKENARTKAAPVVADFVADAARATGEKLRASRTIPSRIADGGDRTTRSDAWAGSDGPHVDDPWASATKPHEAGR